MNQVAVQIVRACCRCKWRLMSSEFVKREAGGLVSHRINANKRVRRLRHQDTIRKNVSAPPILQMHRTAEVLYAAAEETLKTVLWRNTVTVQAIHFLFCTSLSPNPGGTFTVDYHNWNRLSECLRGSQVQKSTQLCRDTEGLAVASAECSQQRWRVWVAARGECFNRKSWPAPIWCCPSDEALLHSLLKPYCLPKQNHTQPATWYERVHRRSQGGAKGVMPPKKNF